MHLGPTTQTRQFVKGYNDKGEIYQFGIILTPLEAAWYLRNYSKYATQAMNELFAKGKIKAQKVCGKWRVHRSRLDDFIFVTGEK